MNYTQIIIFASIPISGALIGWFTNWLAIKMTFYPINFWGIRPIGWQGIIPSKIKKMAEKSIDMLTAKLLKIDERFALINPQRVAEEMQPSLEKLSKLILDEAMEAQFPVIWQNTPKTLKNRVYQNLSTDLPKAIETLMQDIKDEIHQLLDLKVLGVSMLLQNKKLMNEIFLRCGKKEFHFIVISGLYFGLPFGLVQMSISIFYNPWWLLPFFGLLVGYATNWLALKMVFEPLEPKKYLFGLISFQGLFLKRQKEVSEEYAKLITEKILTTENMFEFILRGPGADKLAQIVQKNIEKIIDNTLDNTHIGIVISSKQLTVIRNIACYRFLQELPIYIRDTFAYAEEALDMENMLRNKMQNLSKKEFEGFLRPAFKEDEWILILVGAVLGAIAGFLQYFLLFVG